MEVTVRSNSAGRLRLDIPATAGNPLLAAAFEASVLRMPGVAAVRMYPRSGAVLVWASDQTQAVVLVQALADLEPEPAVHLPRFAVGVQEGDATRLVMGALALVGLFVRRTVLRRPPMLTGGAASGAAVVTLATGYPFFRGAVRSLTGKGRPGTDILVTAATFASLLLRENVVALTVLWLLNVGEFLQELTLRRTRRAISDLLSLGEDQVWLLMTDGTEVSVALELIAPGDVVVAHAPAIIAVDGEIIFGEAVVDQAPVTGESFPVHKQVGDRAFAGTSVVQGTVRIRASAVGSETTVGLIAQRVEAAQADRAPIETLADRFSRRFVPASFALAAVTLAVTRDPRRAMTMLLVACPCAAGLSTPTAVSAAIGNGARRGMLVKGGTHLESAGRVDAVVFDKTGTLTVGRPVVTNVVALVPDWTPDQVLGYAASSEVHTRHPLAQAVIRHSHERRVEIPVHEECEILLGLGVRVIAGGERLLLGNPRLLERYRVAVSPQARDWIDRLEANGETPVCLAHESRLVGILGVTDAIRPEAPVVLDQLRKRGVQRIVMLTGDSAKVASVVAARLGVKEWHADALPEDKLDVVRQLQAQGHTVAMIGDGTNDAPALAVADIGIALGISGTDVAVEAADVALLGSQLPRVLDTLDLGRHALAVVRQNYTLAIGVNSVGLVAGALGTLNPVLAAILHNASSVAVVTNSARLTRYRLNDTVPTTCR